MSLLENRQREPSNSNQIVCLASALMRDVEFNMKQAIKLKEKCGSAGKALAWVYKQLYSEHGFKLIDLNGDEFDTQSADPRKLWKLETLGGKECLDSVMKRYLRRAKNEHQNKLPEHLELFAMVIYFALEISERSEKDRS